MSALWATTENCGLILILLIDNSFLKNLVKRSYPLKWNVGPLDIHHLNAMLCLIHPQKKQHNPRYPNRAQWRKDVNFALCCLSLEKQILSLDDHICPWFAKALRDTKKVNWHEKNSPY